MPELKQIQSRLNHVCTQGDGVPEDYAEAVRWYQMAAEQGHAEAQSQSRGHVCQMAAEGIRKCSIQSRYYVPEDDAEAVRWYQMAAEQG